MLSINWSILPIFVAHLHAFSLKCEFSACLISDLRSAQEIFLYQYFPHNVTMVVYIRLMVRHVDSKILEGIGVYEDSRVYIQSSPMVQRLHLSNKCNIYFLQIKRTGLRDIEFEENDKLEQLKIINSQLTSVTPSLKHSKNLSKVVITHSLIQHIDFSIFCGHAKLLWIDFSHNGIGSVRNSGTDACTINITRLDLSNNLIDSVNLKVFKAFSIVDFVDLSHNLIKQLSDNLDSDTFTHWSLDHNNLFSVSFCESNIPSIVTLNLNNNRLTIIPPCVDLLKSLQYLRLENNFISMATIASFASMTHLLHLDLSYNNMTAIVLSSTRFPPNLLSLNLDKNLLTNLTLPSILMTSLQVRVQNNMIASFDVNGTSPNVTLLDMAGNPIDCSWNTPQERQEVECVQSVNINPKNVYIKERKKKMVYYRVSADAMVLLEEGLGEASGLSLV
ncbi:AGAP005668-PA-like protein [Anopheles sinensis]|uniref:AGAP005668-PA-like protein n=1 Tax=Anopheles sinensis TaxID=74873 RepID=A0A084WUF1_ANOSI|nr:AGAP005668-PA-like protein [Anopheles sinensis]